MYSFDDFFNTLGNFKSCERPDRPPDYYSISGSYYWNEGDKLVRMSTHWGKISFSQWFLDGQNYCGPYKTGWCYYSDLKPISHRYTEEFWNGV